MYCLLLLAGMVIGQPAGPAVADPPLDLVIVNARIRTGDHDASTVLIDGGRIVAVGGDDLWDGTRQATRVIDAAGRRVLPGLIDSHVHLISGGLQLSRLGLRDAASRADLVNRVRQEAARQGPGKWILGRGWSVDSWSDPTDPDRGWIDPVTAGRPAFLVRMDGHQALANSAALALAGINADTPDPVGGRIIKDARTGAPTGLLKDAAMDLVSNLIPPATLAERIEAYRAARRSFLEHGVTMVHTMANPDDGPALVQAALADVTWRVVALLQSDDWIRELTRMQIADTRGSVPWVGLKAYMDGSLGSRTAYMSAPYSDNPATEPANRGLLTEFATRPSPQDMVAQFTRAAAAGYQIAVHAIGDQANHLLLDALAQLKGSFPQARPRIEHAQHLLPEDISRFAALGVVASMQPYHKADDGRYALRRLGHQRCRTSYAFKSLLAHSTAVCFGSDWPVVSNNPFLGIHAAVTGKTLDGQVFVPEQNISVQQALECYTTHAAYACGMEDQLGRIAPGYLADVIVLDRDLLSIPAGDVAGTQVLITVVNGRVVWQHGSWDQP